jgi:hypothetical protein
VDSHIRGGVGPNDGRKSCCASLQQANAKRPFSYRMFLAAISGRSVPHGSALCNLPEVSGFDGIVITVYFRDHPPPHFHVLNAEHQALYDDETVEVTESDLPRTAAKLVVEWATLNQNALRRIWETQDFKRFRRWSKRSSAATTGQPRPIASRGTIPKSSSPQKRSASCDR